MVGYYYVEKNKTLGATFACLSLDNTVYRWRLSDRVCAYTRIRPLKDHEYMLTLQYDDGTEDEEWLGLDYDFGKVGLSKKILTKLDKVVLR